MAWNNSGSMMDALKPGGQSIFTLCMHKTFGLSGCPQCAEAKRLFGLARNGGGGQEAESEARKIYFKKIFWGVGIVTTQQPDKPHNRQICMIQFPQKIVERIVSNVSSSEEDIRWPDPSALADGRQLVIRKFKKDAEFSDYDVTLSNEVSPLTPEYWASVAPSIPDLQNPAELVKAIKTWPSQNVFWPKNAMSDGDRIRVRLLPYARGGNMAPFGMIHVHYVTAPTPWDKAWEEVGYDINRSAEVYAKVPQAAPNSGFGAAPQSPNAVQNMPDGLPQFPTTGMDEVPF